MSALVLDDDRPARAALPGLQSQFRIDCIGCRIRETGEEVPRQGVLPSSTRSGCLDLFVHRPPSASGQSRHPNLSSKACLQGNKHRHDMAWLPPPMTGYVVSAAIFGAYLLVFLVVVAVYTAVIVSQRRSFWVAARLVGRALWPF